MGICRFSINYICRPQVQIQSIFLPLKKIHFCCIFLFCHLFLESSRLCPITCVCRLPVSSHFESSLLCLLLVILNPVYCLVLCPVILCPVILNPVILCPVILSPVILCPVILCQVYFVQSTQPMNSVKKSIILPSGLRQHGEKARQ